MSPNTTDKPSVKKTAFQTLKATQAGMEIGPMMSFAVTGQLLIAVVSSHFAWFDLPVKPITPTKIAGSLSLIIGIILINQE